MDIQTLRLFIVSLYLIIDIAYVISSKNYYEGYIKLIQNSGYSSKAGVYISAVVAYVLLGFGWWILVAERLSKESSIYEILRITIPYSLVIYGVFNATLFVMFDKWDTKIVLRDTLWGVSNIVFISMLYVYSLQYI
jgi:uncharacterized membrane protein